MKIFFIGDVFGKAGRDATMRELPRIKEELKPDAVIANVENVANGRGINTKLARELFNLGVDCMTSGNHIWETPDIFPMLEQPDSLILRPHNYPATSPGRGYTIFTTKAGVKMGVINLQGRIFMDPIDCPFRAANELIEKIARETKIILLDFHADATSEKVAMGWHVDGRVSACVGTHTHVPTADERVLPQGTAYISDVGMTGPYDSIIGMQKSIVLKRFIHKLPERLQVAEGDARLSAVLIDIDEQTGKARSITRVHRRYES